MNIDRMEFIAWMERIMERFDILKNTFSTSKNNDTVLTVNSYWIIRTCCNAEISHRSCNDTARPASYRITPSAGSCTTSYRMYTSSSGIVSTHPYGERKKTSDKHYGLRTNTAMSYLLRLFSENTNFNKNSYERNNK